MAVRNGLGDLQVRCCPASFHPLSTMPSSSPA